MPRKQGFAVIAPERLREIAQMGGRAVQDQGKAYKWTPEKAREAGRLGGLSNKRRIERERERRAKT